MSNSSLVDYRLISPHQYGKRNHSIDTVSIHCVVGQCSIESLGYIFQTKEASSNYGIGYDGRIGQYVDEDCASWCTSDWANDNRAITIEVASDSYDPYKVNDAAYKSLINLLVDICKRNGIPKLVWSTDRYTRMNHLNGCNMTVHRDYANKSCPGDYLYNLHGQIAKEVNERLSNPYTTIKKNCYLYSKDYKDPIGKSMVAFPVNKGAKVKILLDDGCGWSKVDYCGKKLWAINSNLKKSGLSSFRKVKLTTTRKARLIINGKLSKIPRKIAAGKVITIICTITSGDYKGYKFIKDSSGKKYYLKGTK